MINKQKKKQVKRYWILFIIFGIFYIILGVFGVNASSSDMFYQTSTGVIATKNISNTGATDWTVYSFSWTLLSPSFYQISQDGTKILYTCGASQYSICYRNLTGDTTEKTVLNGTTIWITTTPAILWAQDNINFFYLSNWPSTYRRIYRKSINDASNTTPWTIVVTWNASNSPNNYYPMWLSKDWTYLYYINATASAFEIRKTISNLTDSWSVSVYNPWSFTIRTFAIEKNDSYIVFCDVNWTMKKIVPPLWNSPTTITTSTCKWWGSSEMSWFIGIWWDGYIYWQTYTGTKILRKDPTTTDDGTLWTATNSRGAQPWSVDYTVNGTCWTAINTTYYETDTTYTGSLCATGTPYDYAFPDIWTSRQYTCLWIAGGTSQTCELTRLSKAQACSDWKQDFWETSIDYGGPCGFLLSWCERNGVNLYNPAYNTLITPTFPTSYTQQSVVLTGATDWNGVNWNVNYFDDPTGNFDTILIHNASNYSSFNTGALTGTGTAYTMGVQVDSLLNPQTTIELQFMRNRTWADFNYVKFKTNVTGWIQIYWRENVYGIARFYWANGKSYETSLTRSWSYLTAVAQERGLTTQKYQYVKIDLFSSITIQWIEVWLTGSITSNTIDCANAYYQCAFKQDATGQGIYCWSTKFDSQGKDIWGCVSATNSGAILHDVYRKVEEKLTSNDLICTTTINPSTVTEPPENTSVNYTVDWSWNVNSQYPVVPNYVQDWDCTIDWYVDALNCLYKKISLFFSDATTVENNQNKIYWAMGNMWKQTASGSELLWNIWSSGTLSTNSIAHVMMTKTNQLTWGELGQLSWVFFMFKWVIIWAVVTAFIFFALYAI